MSNIRLSSRYAKSLLELCQERNELDMVLNDMRLILEATKESKELNLLLASPVVSGDKKKHVLNSIFKTWTKTTSSFVQLIVSKGREGELSSIAASFVDQVNKMRGIHHAEVISAVALDNTSKSAVQQMAEKMAGGQIILTERIDSSLIGGFVLRVNGQEYNASVTGKLNKIKQDFSKNPYVPAL